MSVNLPSLTLSDIEKDKGGATHEEAPNKLITSLRQNLDQAVGTLGLDQTEKAIAGVAKALKGPLEQGSVDTKQILYGKVEG